jgi:putative transposase
MMNKAFKYRIYGNQALLEKLQWVLDRARELYNAGLSERKDAYHLCVKNHPNYYDAETRSRLTREHAIRYSDQQNTLPEIKRDIRPEYHEIGSHVLQDVLRRLDKAFARFFDRVKHGQKAGYPRFKGRNWYDSFRYPDGAGWKLDEPTQQINKKGRVAVNLHLSKIGTLRLILHRTLEGTIKTLTIKREGDNWYAIFTTLIEEASPEPVVYEDAGIDLGVTHLAALSNGEFIDHPRYFRKGSKKLAKAQQALSRKKRGSHRRKKAVKQVTKCHRKVKNQRRDFHHKASRKIVNRYQVIALEDLQTKNLVKRPKPKQDEGTGEYLPNGASAKSGLTKFILDAGWATFTDMVSYKAESAGRTIVFVSPYMTSQLCHACGAVVKKELADRWHECECGASLDRDTNSAKLILQLGYKQLSGRKGPTLARV